MFIQCVGALNIHQYITYDLRAFNTVRRYVDDEKFVY